MTSADQTTSARELPETIIRYLDAHLARDLDTALGHYTEDAAVTDEGNTYRGHKQIRDWLEHAASEYTYTIALTATEKIDEDHYTATHHLEGDFPGGVVDLRFRFALRDGLIAELVIEP